MKESDQIQQLMQSKISKEEIERAFDERFAEDMKTKFRNARVAIAGLGGLGSNVAVMLARSGVGYLRLIDFDVVDVTNLNRQQYQIKNIGVEKPEALRQILMEINPYLEYEAICEKVTPDNVRDLFADFDIVCEAFDKADQKAMLVQEVLKQCPCCVVVSGNGMAGISDTNEIKTQKVMSRLYVCGDSKTGIEEKMGLIAPRVTACAAHEANKILQLIMETERD